jgi:hypothetical protein
MEGALTIALEDLSGHPELLDSGQRRLTSTNVYAVPVVKLSGAASK